MYKILDKINLRFKTVSEYFEKTNYFFEAIIKEKFINLKKETHIDNLQINHNLKNHYHFLNELKIRAKKSQEIYYSSCNDNLKIKQKKYQINEKFEKNETKKIREKKNENENIFRENYKDYKIHWNNTIRKFKHIFKNSTNIYKQNNNKIISIFDLYSHKYVEIFVGSKIKINDLKFENKKNIIFLELKGKTDFDGYSVDFEFLNLNRKLLNSLINTYYPLDKFENYKKDIDNNILKIFDEYILMLNDEENEIYKNSRILILQNELKNFKYDLKTIKFFFLYVFLYSVQKKKNLIFIKNWVLLYEELVIEHLPNYFNSNKTNYEGLFCVLYMIFEIYFYFQKNKENGFQPYFLKFFRNLSIWNREDIWENIIDFLYEICENPFMNTYYSNLFDNGNGIKKKIKKIRDIYEFLILIGFYLLKIPFKILFDIFNAINDRKKHLNTNFIIDITNKLENHLKNNYENENNNFEKLNFKIKNEDKIKIVFKHSLKYIDFKSEDYKKFLFLSKKTTKKIRKYVYKKVLKTYIPKKNRRIKLWKLISTEKIYIDHDLKNSVFHKTKDKEKYFNEPIKSFNLTQKSFSLKKIEIPDFKTLKKKKNKQKSIKKKIKKKKNKNQIKKNKKKFY